MTGAPARPLSVIAVVVLIALATLAVAWAGRAAEGRRAVAEADAAFSRGDRAEAIFAARVAAEARCPWCTAPDEGFARLEKIARDSEARGDDEAAFAAWRAARAALLATAFTTRASARRIHADNEVARFAHRLDSAAVAAGASPTPAASEERIRRTLADDAVPSGATFALVALGSLLFLVAAARFAAGKKERTRTDLGLAATGAALAAAGALLF